MIKRRPPRVPIPILPDRPASNIIRLIAMLDVPPFDHRVVKSFSEPRDVEYVSKWEWCGFADVHRKEGRDDGDAVGEDGEVDGVDD